MTTMEISLTVNGKAATAAAEPRRHLADFLREDLLLTGTHIGCEQGVCGACTLFVDGRPVRSCITPAVACRDSEVRTVEGFEDDPLMQRLREAFTRHHGLQCGFCTPGMLATAYDIVRRLPEANAERIRHELSGNLCRCTGYAGIVAAIEDVLANQPPSAAVVPLPRRRPATPEASPQKPAQQPAGAAEATAASPAVAREQLAALAESGGPQDGITLSRSLRLDAPAAQVWEVVSDVPTVVSCIPGASLDAAPDSDLLSGRCVVSAGLLRATFRGTALLQLDPAARCGRIAGLGRDALSRSELSGSLDFSLTSEAEAETRLDLTMVYRLKGPLAQFSRPALVEEIADQLLAEVSANIAARAKGAEVAAGETLSGFGLLGGLLKRLFNRLPGLR